jgi:hypothetical protein
MINGEFVGQIANRREKDLNAIHAAIEWTRRRNLNRIAVIYGKNEIPRFDGGFDE